MNVCSAGRFISANGAAVIAVALLLAACDRTSSESPSSAVQDITPELTAWSNENSQRVGATAVKLRSGQCLDTARLPQPWQPFAAHNYTSLGIAALAAELGVVPYEVPGLAKYYDGYPFDGQLHVIVTGWSRPSDRWGTWLAATPTRVAELIKSGKWTRDDGWRDNALDLERYTESTLPIAFIVDPRRYTQCRDTQLNGEIRCSVIASDEQFAFFVRLAAASRSNLPTALGKILGVVEEMGGMCSNQ